MYQIAEYTSKTTSQLRPELGTFSTPAAAFSFILETMPWVSLDDLQNMTSNYAVREVAANA
jgi:hypothetical protein